MSLLSVKTRNEYDCAEERQRVLALVGSPTIWERVSSFIRTQSQASEAKLYQKLSVKLCGNVPATRSDRAVLERLGRIIEMGQRVAKGTTH